MLHIGRGIRAEIMKRAAQTFSRVVQPFFCNYGGEKQTIERFEHPAEIPGDYSQSAGEYDPIGKGSAQSFEECPCCHNLPAPTGEEGRELHFYIQAAVHRGYRVLF